MSSAPTLIVAATLANGIGKKATLPWHLPKEMKYFQSVTTSAPEGSLNAVVMGRKTWESIPEKFRPLPKRLNVIVSQNEYLLEDFKSTSAGTPKPMVCNHMKDAVLQLVMMPFQSPNAPKIHRIFVIGGASMYREFLGLPPAGSTSTTNSSPFTDRILFTRIVSPAFEDCDVHFPEIREMKRDDGTPMWEKASHKDLTEWVGIDVPEEVQEEKEVKYEFEMWTRRK